MCEPYAGYSNQETWAVCLWIDGEQWAQDAVLDHLRDYREAKALDGLEPNAREAGEIVKYEVDGWTDPDRLDDWWLKWAIRFLSDVGSLYRVDWDEVGASMLATLKDVG